MLKSKVNWQEVTRLVLLSRELDLLEEEVLAPEGKIKYQFSAKGHELSQVLLSLELDHPHDAAGDRGPRLQRARGRQPRVPLPSRAPAAVHARSDDGRVDDGRRGDVGGTGREVGSAERPLRRTRQHVHTVGRAA